MIRRHKVQMCDLITDLCWKDVEHCMTKQTHVNENTVDMSNLCLFAELQ